MTQANTVQYPLHMISLGSLQEFSKEVPKDEELKELDGE